MAKQQQRLLSIDALRGFDMFFIMGFAEIVRAVCELFPFPWAEWLSSQMVHPSWDGFSHHDTIFPLFLFLAGVSFPFSLNNQISKGATRSQIYKKIVIRAFMLFVLGLIYNGLLQFNFAEARIPSVLARIGIAWMVAAIIFINTSMRSRIAISALTLIAYTAIITTIPSPNFSGDFSTITLENNIVGYIDSLIMPGHLYLGTFDPEGLFSTIPAVVTALLGMFAGELIRSEKWENRRKASLMAIIGVSLVVAGVLFGQFFQINKSLWSAPFVALAGGYSFIMLSIFYYIIDVKGYTRWTTFFKVIGMNSILIYMAQQLISFGHTNNFLFAGFASLFPESIATIILAITYTGLCWSLLYFCYKKGVFLKV